jgi:hypothetical protein
MSQRTQVPAVPAVVEQRCHASAQSPVTWQAGFGWQVWFAEHSSVEAQSAVDRQPTHEGGVADRSHFSPCAVQRGSVAVAAQAPATQAFASQILPPPQSTSALHATQRWSRQCDEAQSPSAVHATQAASTQRFASTGQSPSPPQATHAPSAPQMLRPVRRSA